MNGPGLRPLQLCRLALADLWHERWLALCAACVIAAALAPLWTLRGLAHGAVDAVLTELERDPRTRLVESEGATREPLTPQWYARVAQWPEVVFVQPKTMDTTSGVRLLSRNVDLPVQIWLLPSGAGDPSLGTAAAPQGLGVTLTSEAAQRLKVGVGDEVWTGLSRRHQGVESRHLLTLEVVSITAPEIDGSLSGRVSLPLLDAMLDWYDPDRRPEAGGQWQDPSPQDEPLARSYRRFRAFAPSLQGVEALARRFEAEGLNVTWSSSEVVSVLALQRNLRSIFLLIAIIATTGAALAVAALQLATQARKRRDHAMLLLTGHGRSWLVGIAVLQSLLIALVGALLAALIYQLAAEAINRHFGEALFAAGRAVRLPAGDAGFGAAVAGLVALLPAAFGAWRAGGMDVADALRETG